MKKIDIVGRTFIHPKYGEYSVVSAIYSNGKDEYDKVLFSDTGYAYVCEKRNIKKNRVRDPFARTIYGVACIGDIVVTHKDRLLITAFKRWSQMINRCYNTNSHSYKPYGGNGVKVCDRWLVFKNFYSDLTSIDGFDSVKYIRRELELDKDIVGDGYEYSPTKCILVSPSINRRFKKKTMRAFVAFSPSGEQTEYLSIRQCAMDNNLTERTIGKVLHRQLKSHKGWKFKYQEEIENEH